MIPRENHEWDDALGMSPTPWHPHCDHPGCDLPTEVSLVSDQDFPPFEHERCACDTKLVSCHGCADERCLECDPYTEYERLNRCCTAIKRLAPKESVCAEADRLTSTERGHNYGPPIDDFGKVIGMAQALWGRGPETEEEHALYMILVKLSRLANNPQHRDSLVDIAGYAKTYEMILDARKDLKDGGFA